MVGSKLNFPEGIEEEDGGKNEDTISLKQECKIKKEEEKHNAQKNIY